MKSRELASLASALGFPSDLFRSAMLSATDDLMQVECTRLQGGKLVSEESLKYLLDSGLLNRRLEKTFNKHDAEYNKTVILKAASLLRRGRLSYGEISLTRVAFELYSAEDASGIPAEIEPVTQALKFIDRIMAPARLEAEIQKQQHYCDLPSRIQLYEFFDLVVRCSTSKEAYIQMQEQKGSPDHATNSDTPNISKLLKTSEQQVNDYLDESYKASLFKTVDPCPVPLEEKRAVSVAPRRALRSVSTEHSYALVPHIERSQQLLYQARNGTMVLSSSQYKVVESRPCTSLSREIRGRQKSKQIPLDSVDTMVSKSAPCILDQHQVLDSEDYFSDTITKSSLDSNKRARGAINCSFVSPKEPTNSLPTDDSSRFTSRERGVALTEIVTKEDIRRHQDRISELEWEGLKRKGKHFE